MSDLLYSMLGNKSASPAHIQEGYLLTYSRKMHRPSSRLSTQYIIIQSWCKTGKTLKATGAKRTLSSKKNKKADIWLKIFETDKPNLFQNNSPTYSHTKHCLSLGQNKYQIILWQKENDLWWNFLSGENTEKHRRFECDKQQKLVMTHN